MLRPDLPTSIYTFFDNDFITREDQPAAHYVLRVKDLPDNEKPREKLLQLGPQALTLPELVAVLWVVGTKKEELLNMAQRLVKEYGEKALLSETNPKKLAEALEIPLNKSCQLIVGYELGRRFFTSHGNKAAFVRNARQAYNYLREIGYNKKEHLRGLYLNSRYQVIHDELISIGSLTSNIIHPREVFLPAIENGAVAIIIGHNHPSGSLEPTNADIIVTEQLLQAGKILGIELLDHLIIAKQKYISILETMHHDLQTQI